MSNEKQKLLTEEYLKFILETFFDGVSMSDLYKVLTEFKKETGKSPLNWVIRIKKENHIFRQEKYISEINDLLICATQPFGAKN